MVPTCSNYPWDLQRGAKTPRDEQEEAAEAQGGFQSSP